MVKAGEAICGVCGAHVAIGLLGTHGQHHVAAAKFKPCRFGCGRSFVYKRCQYAHYLYCPNRNLGINEQLARTTRSSCSGQDHAESGDEAEIEIAQCLSLHGFDPQAQAVIKPEHSLLWQTVRCNGNSDSWFYMDHDDDKGRMIRASRKFESGVVLMEYFGQTILGRDAYAEFLERSSYDVGETEYLFEFDCGDGERVAIQAQMEDGTFGRLVNHSSVADANCKPRFLAARFPRLVLLSTRQIQVGEEIIYSYGDEEADRLLLNG